MIKFLERNINLLTMDKYYIDIQIVTLIGFGELSLSSIVQLFIYFEFRIFVVDTIFKE